VTLYDTPTPEEIIDDQLLSLAAGLPTVRRAPGSTADLESRGIALLASDLHQHVTVLERTVTPRDADEPGLVEWGETLVVPRKGPTGSSAQQGLRCEGVALTALPAGTLLTSASGVPYQIATATSIGAGGTVDADVESVGVGLDTQLGEGERLTFDVAIPSINPTATVVRAITGGADEESIGAWRDRQEAVWRSKRQGGSATDYAIWALELDWVDRAYVYPGKPTIDAVGVVALRAGDIVIPTPAQEAELLAYLNERRPVTDMVYVLTVSERRPNVEIVVTLLPGTVPDWTRPVGGLTLNSYDPATRVLTTNETIPSDLVAGALLTVVEATVTTDRGEPARVAAVTGGTTMVLAPLVDGAPLKYTPAGGEEIYASSASMAAARQAVLDGATTCENFQVTGLDAMGPANPAKKYGPWESDFRADLIQTMATIQAGIESAIVTFPPGSGTIVESIEFPFPNDLTVELLRPGQVVLRV